jgi:hypothetical protein
MRLAVRGSIMNAANTVRAIALLMVGYAGAALVTAQDLREVAREHSRRSPGAVLEHTAPPAEYPVKAIEEVATQADVVLQGTLLRSRSYLGATADRVLTDYLIEAPQVISGSLPTLTAVTPGTAPPLTLTVYGGEVTVEGVRIRSTDNNRAAIDDGANYVVALRRSRALKPGHYEVYNGAIFEVKDGRVTPLIKQADRVFKGTVDSDASQLIQRLRAARKGR